MIIFTNNLRQQRQERGLRIHHLNCGSHCPVGGFLFDGTSKGPLANICTHCLLVETADCLVLVDTGYGLKDVKC